ncbi:hypothetical protein M3G04_02345 [Dietzia cinnamea]|uniref:hypothetical protein n=1 Tax=Dietzia cinnamea TaxID=321318 RepID=UPI00223B13FD|nr:hypothetical protein [Dietzia cinnamea]MCT2299750.1 hypothetical protein [Dietzia cinnamea]
MNRSSAVRQGCEQVAQRLAARAQAHTNAAGGQARIRVESTQRPKGRWQSRVISDRPDEEYGSEKQKRIRPLGRAMREV